MVEKQQSCAPGRMELLWQRGQDYLARGRYVAAATTLERAAALAFAARDSLSIARIYLPLLESRRQWRQLACEGVVRVVDTAAPGAGAIARLVADSTAGTLVVAGPRAATVARRIQHKAMQNGATLEALLLLSRGQEHRLASTASPVWATALPVKLVDAIPAPSAEPQQPATLPFASNGRRSGGTNDPALQTMAGESLLLAWEAMALRWQARTAVRPRPWAELAWLRQSLLVDPACEPIMMRIISLAEAMAGQ